MAKAKKEKGQVGKKAAGVAGVAMAALELLPTIIDNAQPAIDALKRQIGTGSNKVTVPNLHKKGFALPVEKADELLSNYGLRAVASELHINEARSKYRSCFAGQVVDCSPKQGQKVSPGSTVLLKYVTQEVIDASQAKFEEERQRKAEAKEAKSEKRAARAEHAKALAADTAKKAKDGLLKALPHPKKPPELPEAQEPCEETSGPDTDM